MDDIIQQKNLRLRKSHIRFLASKKKQGFSSESEFIRSLIDAQIKKEKFKG